MYDCISFSNINTIYVHCRKIYNLFARALETDRRASLWRAFLAYFAASANSFYIQRQCTYIVFILRYQKVQNNCQIFWTEQKQASFNSFSNVTSITSVFILLHLCLHYHICVYTITSVFILSHLCLHYHICVYTITSVFILSHLCLHYHICVYTITSVFTLSHLCLYYHLLLSVALHKWIKNKNEKQKIPHCRTNS